MFPNGWEVSMVEGEVEEGGEEADAVGTEVLEVEIGKVVGTEGGGVFREPDGVGDVGGGEGGVVGNEFEFLDGAVDTAGERILFMRRRRRVLFVEELGDDAFFGASFGAGGRREGDRKVRRLVSAFAGELTKEAEERGWVG